MQELDKANLQIHVIRNGLEKYLSFCIIKMLTFINSFLFLSSLSDSLIKNLGKNVFKYLKQEFDNNDLDIAKQKEFYPYEYMNDFEKFKEQLPNK